MFKIRRPKLVSIEIFFRTQIHAEQFLLKIYCFLSDNALLFLHWKIYKLTQTRTKNVSYCFYSSMSSGFFRDAAQLNKNFFSALASN